MNGLTRDDIIRMAREAELLTTTEPNGYQVWIPENLERFVAFVYTEGHKDGLDDFEAGVLPAAIKAEREACAKLCDAHKNPIDDPTAPVGQYESGGYIMAEFLADAIRARGSHA